MLIASRSSPSGLPDSVMRMTRNSGGRLVVSQGDKAQIELQLINKLGVRRPHRPGADPSARVSGRLQGNCPPPALTAGDKRIVRRVAMSRGEIPPTSATAGGAVSRASAARIGEWWGDFVVNPRVLGGRPGSSFCGLLCDGNDALEARDGWLIRARSRGGQTRCPRIPR